MTRRTYDEIHARYGDQHDLSRLAYACRDLSDWNDRAISACVDLNAAILEWGELADEGDAEAKAIIERAEQAAELEFDEEGVRFEEECSRLDDDQAYRARRRRRESARDFW